VTAAIPLRRPRSLPARTRRERIVGTAQILAAHLPPLTLFYTGTRREDWIALGVLYLFNMFGLGASMHRYFTHKAFRTSRTFQFFLALLAAVFYGDPIHFAGSHRLHHRFSDTDRDPHSPREGAWHCWIGNLIEDGYTERERLEMVPDLTRYPELMWVHRHWFLVGSLAALAVYLSGGYTMAVLAFGGNLLLKLHLMSAINFFGHRGEGGPDGDLSTNNAFLGIFCFGEGWHHNHHLYPGAARSGVRWYELDVVYYILKILSWVGLVWELREVPEAARRRAC